MHEIYYNENVSRNNKQQVNKTSFKIKNGIKKTEYKFIPHIIYYNVFESRNKLF